MNGRTHTKIMIGTGHPRAPLHNSLLVWFWDRYANSSHDIHVRKQAREAGSSLALMNRILKAAPHVERCRHAKLRVYN